DVPRCALTGVAQRSKCAPGQQASPLGIFELFGRTRVGIVPMRRLPTALCVALCFAVAAASCARDRTKPTVPDRRPLSVSPTETTSAPSGSPRIAAATDVPRDSDRLRATIVAAFGDHAPLYDGATPVDVIRKDAGQLRIATGRVKVIDCLGDGGSGSQ